MITDYTYLGGDKHPADGFESKKDLERYSISHRTCERVIENAGRFFALNSYTEEMPVESVQIEPIYHSHVTGRGGRVDPGSIIGRAKEAVGLKKPVYSVLSDSRVHNYKVWVNNRCLYTFPARFNVEILRALDAYLSSRHATVTYSREIKSNHGWLDNWIGVSLFTKFNVPAAPDTEAHAARATVATTPETPLKEFKFGIRETSKGAVAWKLAPSGRKQEEQFRNGYGSARIYAQRKIDEWISIIKEMHAIDGGPEYKITQIKGDDEKQ